MEPWLHFFDLVDLDYGRSMDAEKLFWIQLPLQPTDGFAQEVMLQVIINAHVVSFGLNALNVVNIEEEHTAAVFDHEPLEITRPCLQLFEQCKNVLIALARPVLLDASLGTLP